MPPVTDPPVGGPTGRVAGSLNELRLESSVYDDLHVEARRVLDRNPEPRNLRDIAVALESMGYTASGAQKLGFDSVFELAMAVFDLTYLYYVPRKEEVPEPRPTWRWFLEDYLAGSWYGVPWIMSIVVLFVGRVALWSSLDATPQVAAIVSLAFFIAAVVAGASSQMLARRGTFYFPAEEPPAGPLGGCPVPRLFDRHGPGGHRRHLRLLRGAGTTDCAWARSSWSSQAPFSRSCSVPPRSTCSAVSTPSLWPPDWPSWSPWPEPICSPAARPDPPRATARAGGGLGALCVIAASYMAMRTHVDAGMGDSLVVVKPPVLRVVLWHSAPYGVYGFAYFVMILVGPLVVGLAYGRSLGVGQYVYPSAFKGSVAIALLELVVLLGLVNASVERFGRRLRPLLEGHTLDCWASTRAALRREWIHSVGLVVVVSGLVAWLVPSLLVQVLPASLTAGVRSPGGLLILEASAYGFAMVPIGMLCSQYLFFLGRPTPALPARSVVLDDDGGDGGTGSWRRPGPRSLGPLGRNHRLRPRHRPGLLPGPGRRRGILLCRRSNRRRGAAAPTANRSSRSTAPRPATSPACEPAGVDRLVGPC